MPVVADFLDVLRPKAGLRVGEPVAARCSAPNTYLSSGCIPLPVKSVVGSSFGTSGPS